MKNQSSQKREKDKRAYILLAVSFGLLLTAIVSGNSYLSADPKYYISGSMEAANLRLRIFIYSAGFCLFFFVWGLKRLVYARRPNLFYSILAGLAAIAGAAWYTPHFLDEEMPFSSQTATETVIALGYTPSWQVMKRIAGSGEYDELIVALMGKGATLDQENEDLLFMRTPHEKQEALLRIFLSQKRGYHDGNLPVWIILDNLLGKYQREDLFPLAVSVLQNESGKDGIFKLWFLLQRDDELAANVVKRLLACGVSPKISVGGESALAAAVAKGSVEHMALLLQAVGEPGKEGFEAAEAAVRHGRPEIFALLVKSGVDLSGVNDKGLTLLHTAAAHGDEAATRQLLKAGGSVDARDADGRPPLHYAAYFAAAGALEALLEAGASVAAKDSKGVTALHYFAAKSVDSQAASDDFLVDKALFTHRDDYGATVAHLLVALPGTYPEHPWEEWMNAWSGTETWTEDGMRKTLAALTKAKADPLAVDSEGRIPIQYAFLEPGGRNRARFLHALLQSGLDPHERDADGRDLFMLLQHNDRRYAGALRRVLEAYGTL